MDKKIKNILHDLYAIDDSLKQHEAELIKIIRKLLASRPNTHFDKKFARELRSEILKRAGDMPESRQLKTKTNLFINFNLTNMFNVKQLSYAGAGVAVILFAVIIWRGGLLSPDETKFAMAPEITKLGGRAFGSLTEEAGQALLDGDAAKVESLAAPEAAGLGGGGGIARTQSGGGGDYMAMPVPDAVKLNYIYLGEELNFEKSAVDVLRRVKGEQLSRGLADKIKSVDLGGFNFAQFSDLSLESINFNEEREYGYNISISPKEGVFSLSQNWMRWPHTGENCNGSEKCFLDLQIKPQDVPADDVLIKIADGFVKQIGIDTKSYGRPEVNQSFRGPKVQYIGESVQVIYPLLINGQAVYEESGEKVGINVSVNIRYNRVDGLWNYRTEQYEASSYEAETDMKRVLKFASQGGRYSRYGWDQADKTADIVLGTPSIGYARIWKYERNESFELLVPSYIFPIIEKPENSYIYFNSVSVPLAKELLDQSEKEWGGIEPRPMPEQLFNEKAVELDVVQEEVEDEQ